MNYTLLFEEIRALIAKNRLKTAFDLMGKLLNNSPALDEAILQSARWHDIRKHIRQGTLSRNEIDLNLNQIRTGMLDLLREIEEQSEKTEIRKEIEDAYSLMSRENSRRKWLQIALLSIGSIILMATQFFKSLFSKNELKSEPKIQVNGNKNTIIDMSNSDSNTVNQTIYEGTNTEKSKLDIKKTR